MPTQTPVASSQIERELTVLNELGIHARPAAEFVRCARQFVSRIEIVHRGPTFSAQDLLGVLMAGLSAGARFRLRAEGPDADLAIEMLSTLLGHFSEREKTSENLAVGSDFEEARGRTGVGRKLLCRVSPLDFGALPPAPLSIAPHSGR